MEYKSLDKFEIKSRGTVFVVINEKTRARDNNDLLGSEVTIDGQQYVVKGVESFAKAMIQKGDKIGLCVGWQVVIRNNGIIAEFMGATKEQWYPPSKDTSGVHYSYPKDCYPDNEKYHCDFLLKYHTDWNWLLPVVKKLRLVLFNGMSGVGVGLNELDINKVYEHVVGYITILR